MTKGSITRIERALQFYAKEGNYYESHEIDFPFRTTKIEHDRGEKAKQALKDIESIKSDIIKIIDLLEEDESAKAVIIKNTLERFVKDRRTLNDMVSDDE